MDEVGFSAMPEAMEQLAAIARTAETAHRRMRDLAVTVAGRNHLFEVTVGAQGEVTGFDFSDDRYRTLAPAELGQLILDTLQEAQQQAARSAEGVVGELFPERPVPVVDAYGERAGVPDVVGGLLGYLEGMGISPQDAAQLREAAGGGRRG